MELADTFRNMAKARSLTLNAEADKAMVRMMTLIQKERGSQSDDARNVSNILSLAVHNMDERLKNMQCNGIQPTPEQRHEIRPEDFRIKYL